MIIWIEIASTNWIHHLPISASAVLRCWRCSTDVSNGEFCNDPFMPETISEQQRYWSYVNCTYSVGAKSVNARPVCKKLVQEGEIEPPHLWRLHTRVWHIKHSMSVDLQKKSTGMNNWLPVALALLWPRVRSADSYTWKDRQVRRTWNFRSNHTTWNCIWYFLHCRFLSVGSGGSLDRRNSHPAVAESRTRLKFIGLTRFKQVQATMQQQCQRNELDLQLQLPLLLGVWWGRGRWCLGGATTTTTTTTTVTTSGDILARNCMCR